LLFQNERFIILLLALFIHLRFNSIGGINVIFIVDLRVILVFTTTTLAFRLAIHQLIVFFYGIQEVCLFAL
jgi:hypothetical protein